MTLSRTAQRTVLTVALLSVSALAAPSTARAAAPLPPACQEALLETLDKFPVVDFTVPDKAQNTMLGEVLGLSEADQAVFTEAACAAWNTWATQNGQAVATDLDTRYRNAAGPVCNKFARSSLATIKKHAPNVPAATRDMEKVAKKVWSSSMEKLAADATNADCRTAYNAVKAGW
ncbi:hypothetical protein N7925_32700 [Streptomyces sp. CA-278952]|uniref:hypothetical protein n=1 Tax=Streptomyces sp. CA-278952 TaxID=2980556 RepID=UPI002367C15D|nr:hypothetical protein [Streptomyces sp. CA-278952]WDG32751.1 hypothetical protein N7925_32700 [Streptomyces sp. CA-278952]